MMKPTALEQEHTVDSGTAELDMALAEELGDLVVMESVKEASKQRGARAPQVSRAWSPQVSDARSPQPSRAWSLGGLPD